MQILYINFVELLGQRNSATFACIGFSEQYVRALPLDKRQLQFTNSLDLNGAEP